MLLQQSLNCYTFPGIPYIHPCNFAAFANTAYTVRGLCQRESGSSRFSSLLLQLSVVSSAETVLDVSPPLAVAGVLETVVGLLIVTTNSLRNRRYTELFRNPGKWSCACGKFVVNTLTRQRCNLLNSTNNTITLMTTMSQQTV